jgi:colicin import membrane protein
MDDEKSIAEKFTDAIAKATDSVKATMSNIVDTASVAAQHAMESNAERISGQTVAELSPGIPAAGDAVAMPPPLVAVQPVSKKRTLRPKASSVKAPPAKKAAKKSAPRKAKKAVKKSAKKSTGKKTGKKKVKQVAKKSAKKSAKKNTKGKSRR